jgi:predicted DNA-binding protein YlxM (UPF0122 family)
VRTHAQRASDASQEIIGSWLSGETIASIARRHGIRRQAVSNLLEREGVRTHHRDAKWESRNLRRDEVLEYVRTHPGCSVSDIAETLEYDRRSIAEYLRGTDEALLVLHRKTKARAYTRSEMLDAIRDVWRRMTPQEQARGLSRARYEAMSGEDAPSPSLFERRFEGWSQACQLAGVHAVEPSRSQASYRRTFSDEDLVQAVADYMRETRKTSFSGYVEWARSAPGRPSGSLVTIRFKRWGAARAAVIARGEAG